MKVKLMQLSGHRCYECGVSEMASSVTDWDEVTAEEAEALEQWVTHQNSNRYNSISHYVVVKQIDYVSVKKMIQDFVAEAKEARQKKKEREEALAQRQQKRLETIKARKVAKEKALLEKLQAKYT